MSDSSFDALLEMAIPQQLVKVERRLLDELAAAYRLRTPQHAGLATRELSAEGQQLLALIEFIKPYIVAQLDAIAGFHKRYDIYTRRFSGAATQEEKRQHIIDFAAELGASARQLRGDKRAFSRWFGHDAVVERYQRRLVELERKLAFCLGRLGTWSAALLNLCESHSASKKFWRRLDIEAVIKPLLAYQGDARVRIETFRCLAKALQAVPGNLQESCVTDSTLQYIYRAAMERRQEVWIQCEALSLLETLSLASLHTVLILRLGEPGTGDDLFVRCHAVRLLFRNVERLPALAGLLGLLRRDTSPAVRQAVTEGFTFVSPHLAYHHLAQLALDDDTPCVRASALLQFPALIVKKKLLSLAEETLRLVFQQEHDEFVLRAALKVACDNHDRLVEQKEEILADIWYAAVIPLFETVHENASSLSVRRWAAQARERLWSQASPERLALRETLAERLTTIAPGSSRLLTKPALHDVDEATAGRVLSVLAQKDFGLDVTPGRWWSRLTRGHVFGFRTWRFWHEMRHPATDKRQGFAHTKGRIFNGSMRVPSSIVAELAQTKVPGEPLHMESEAGWRPYLPLVDEVISCLDQSLSARPVRFYTSEGITELKPPASLAKRLTARTALTMRFAHYAALRNWQEGDQENPNAYAQALVALGIGIAFRPHAPDRVSKGSADPAVQRFFPAVLPFSDNEWWPRLQDYFMSVYENSLSDLAIFLAGIGTLFAGRHVYLNQAIRQARAGIPLVIGGWGTRGKSGTERLKAALINALGYSVVAKTTGCEAMFLYAPPYGRTREMFLFRPYDKATIWEQSNVMRLAEKLRADVFLWECMALTPSYVEILQNDWVKDDIATITNTYPDHEDLQGPAGINIPEVMTNFIPKRSLLITSEEQMLPILRSAATQRGTRTETVGWLEAGLVPPDMLKRFPYEEHPYNIALVIKLAAQLDVGRDFTLKEMADRVVQDLGVLKAYPAASLRGRRLEFINGMSANERFGCLNNWQRMGFTDHDYEEEPGVWLTTVVNNRADRVARSKVFATMLVEDLNADRHFIIGTNIDGLLSYIREAWDQYIQHVSLWATDTATAPELVLDKIAERFRLPVNEEHIVGQLRAMLTSQSIDIDLDAVLVLHNDTQALRKVLEEHNFPYRDEVLQHLERSLEIYKEYKKLKARLASSSQAQRKDLEAEFRALAWRWFKAKLVVLEDPHLSGDQIIERICAETPPGFHNRIMGVQNIKGTGLDFVYRWQAWEYCHRVGSQMMQRKEGVALQGLRDLASFQEYGLLCETFVRETVARAQDALFTQNEAAQAELQLILSNLDAAVKRIRSAATGASGAGVVNKIAAAIEEFLDAGDAVKRRKLADRIYRDMANQRISHERAALELQALNKRQKGGWLTKQLGGLFSVLRRANTR